jgi:hypothetical protein
MPLHDWTDLPGWEGVHQIWIVELLYWIKPRLPEGYRAYIGTSPTFAVDAPPENRPDVGVRTLPQGNGASANGGEPAGTSPGASSEEPDEEIAVARIEIPAALLVERRGQLVAAVELVSPGNKDRPAACAAYAQGYAGYLLKGIHLLLVDVHRRPLRFSFADQIAAELELQQPPCPAPFAVSYRVGEPAPGGGRFLAVWRRPLAFGAALPPMKLHLSVSELVEVDLEQTYARAAAAAYLN